jgi:hypothetical protein
MPHPLIRLFVSPERRASCDWGPSRNNCIFEVVNFDFSIEDNLISRNLCPLEHIFCSSAAAFVELPEVVIPRIFEVLLESDSVW